MLPREELSPDQLSLEEVVALCRKVKTWTPMHWVSLWNREWDAARVEKYSEYELIRQASWMVNNSQTGSFGHRQIFPANIADLYDAIEREGGKNINGTHHILFVNRYEGDIGNVRIALSARYFCDRREALRVVVAKHDCIVYDMIHSCELERESIYGPVMREKDGRYVYRSPLWAFFKEIDARTCRNYIMKMKERQDEEEARKQKEKEETHGILAEIRSMIGRHE